MNTKETADFLCTLPNVIGVAVGVSNGIKEITVKISGNDASGIPLIFEGTEVTILTNQK